MGDVHAPDQWALATLAIQAMEASTKHTNNSPGKQSSDINWLIIFKGVLPMLTLVAGFAGKYLMEHFYTLMILLSAVETPLPGGVDSQDVGSEKYGLLEGDSYKDKKQVLSTFKSDYITSSIRATIRHLNAEAGDLSMFRGIGTVSAVYLLMIPMGIVLELILNKLPLIKKHNLVADTFAHHTASLILCQILATALHVCISKPRYKFWFRRMPMTWFGVLRTAWLAIVVNCLAEDIIEAAFYYFSKPKEVIKLDSENNNNQQFQLSDGPLVKISTSIVLWACIKSMLRSQIKPVARLVLVTPFEAIEIRVNASMLRDDEDPIIPMDRSFKGRPQSGGILQQQAKPLGFTEAVRTIDKPTYIRLVKLNFKLHVIKQLIEWAFWTLIFAETIYFLGPSAVWVVLKLISGTPVVQTDLDSVQGNTTRAILNSIIAAPRNLTSPSLNMTITPLSFEFAQ